MTALYIKLSTTDFTWLNQILMDNYVYKNGNYLFPYRAGTTRYFPTDSLIVFWDETLDRALNDSNLSTLTRTRLATIKLLAKTYDEAVSLGWIILPPLLPIL